MEIASHPFIILLGPPGSGKGTQGKRLSRELDLPIMSVGGMIRVFCATHTDATLCREIQDRYERGIPQPDDVVITIVSDYLDTHDVSRGLISDAFPLTLVEAEALETMRSDHGLDTPVVFFLSIDVETAVERIAHRKVCSQCSRTFTPSEIAHAAGVCDSCGGALITRPDDHPDIVRHRFEEYRTRLDQVCAYYKDRGVLHVLDATAPSDVVYAAILAVCAEKGYHRNQV